jgi:hypothetical protein
VDVKGFRAALDDMLARRLDVPTEGSVYIAKGLSDMNQLSRALLTDEELSARRS